MRKDSSPPRMSHVHVAFSSSRPYSPVIEPEISICGVVMTANEKNDKAIPRAPYFSNDSPDGSGG